MRIQIAVAIIAILFVSGIVGTIIYYSGMIGDKNKQINSLKEQIARDSSQIINLTAQVANLQSEIANLTSANLVQDLNVTEEINNSDLVQMFPNMPVFSVPYQSLWINGSITNIGFVTAYKAGLHVIGYASDGTLEVNMTVPLVINSVYGTDQTIDALIVNNPRFHVGNDIGSLQFGQIGSLDLGTLAVGQRHNIFLAIYHEGIVSNWTVTPVWTNTP